MKSFFISSRSAPSVVTPVFLYSSPSRRRSQTSQHKLSVLKSRFISPLTEDHRIHNELLQINKINCNFLATDERFTYVNCCSFAKSCLTLCDPTRCSMPGFLVLHCLRSLLKLMSIESLMPSNHPILCRHLLLLPSIFPSIRDFSNESVFHIR